MMKLPRTALVLGILVAVAALALVVGMQLRATPRVVLRPDDAKMLALGANVYAARCAACHGSQLEGQPDWRSRGPDGLLPAPPHDENGHTWHHADELLFRITKLGVGPAINDPGYRSAMPAFSGVLSDEEIIAALSWIKSRWPAAVREHHDAINAPPKRQ
jgi:S-disulfanyl-L-cysteine oxidoreductase SoxD